MLVIVVYVDYSVSREIDVFDISVPDLEHAHKACESVFRHAHKPGVALINVSVQDENCHPLYEWTPKDGWKKQQ